MGWHEEVMGQYPARKGMPQDDVSRSPFGKRMVNIHIESMTGGMESMTGGMT